MNKIEKLIKYWKEIRPKHSKKIASILIISGITGQSAPYWWPFLKSLFYQVSEHNPENSNFIGDSGYFYFFLILCGVMLTALDLYSEHLTSKQELSTKDKSERFKTKQEHKPLFEADEESSIKIYSGIIKSSRPISKVKNKSKFEMHDTDIDALNKNKKDS